MKYNTFPNSLLHVSSFNCKHLKTSIDEIRELCKASDVVLLQETWLLEHDLHLLNMISPDHYAKGISSVDCQEKLLVGRPHGGLAVLWRKTLGAKCKPIVIPEETRIMGLEIQTSTQSIMLVNVYLPYNSRENVHEFDDYLNRLSGIIQAADTPYIYCVGDFNADCSGNQLFGRKLKSFCQDESLLITDLEFLPASSTFTYHSASHNITTWLDHIITTNTGHGDVEAVSVEYKYITSDHFPISMSITIRGVSPDQDKDEERCEENHVYIKWDRLNNDDITQYTTETENTLAAIPFDHNLALCDSLTCEDVSHIAAIDRLYANIIEALIDASRNFQRRGKTISQDTIAGWNSTVREHHAQARDAFLRWRACGSLSDTTEYEDMCRTRSIFKRVLRQCKIDKDRHEADGLAKTFLNKQSRDFWKTVKDTKKDKVNAAVTSIGSVTGIKNVCNKWKDYFNELLNSNANHSIKQNVLQEIEAGRDEFDLLYDGFTQEEVLSAINKLKCNKAAGKDCIQAEHFKYGHPRLYILLCMLFNSAMVHSHLPQAFMDTIITPIVKDKKDDLTDQDNYRPIAVTCVASKILEEIILDKYSSVFNTSDHQFGFKKNHSTDMCVFTLKEITEKYITHGSPVYMTFMDASKAFDKVNHWVLVDKLISRGLPCAIVRILLKWYETQNFYVKWCGCLSTSFKVSNGVRQGGILSPILYNLFMDDLSVRLSKSFSGCFINGQSANHLLYADDSVLLAPSPHALQELIDICQNYANECGITYNIKKTKCMCVKPAARKDVNIPNVFLNSKPLVWVKKKKYLGVWLTENLNDNIDIQRQVCAMYSRGNMLLRKFRKCSAGVKAHLFKTFCSNLYCAPLWCTYTATIMEHIKIAYNNVFRMFMSVRRRHTSIMYLHYGIDCFSVLLRKCIFKFKQRMLVSNNNIVRTITNSMYFLQNSRLNNHWTNTLYFN